jgi:hypothetical protein
MQLACCWHHPHCVNSLPRVNLLNEKAPLFEFRTRNKGGSKLDGSPAFVLIGSVVPAL